MKVSLCLIFRLQSILLGCAGEAQKRMSLRLWLEGPTQVESGVRSTLRTVGRTKAEGAQVCCIHLGWGLAFGVWADICLRQATQGLDCALTCPALWMGRKKERPRGICWSIDLCSGPHSLLLL